MKVNILAEWHSDYAWECLCGNKNIETEGQLDIEEGDYVSCGKCGKQYWFDKIKLELNEEDGE